MSTPVLDPAALDFAKGGGLVTVVAQHAHGGAVLARVVPAGPACHTGSATCFGDSGAGDVLGALDATIAARTPNSRGYTARLLADRNLRLKKVGEECAEFLTACADGDRARIAEEAADLWYHLLVAARAMGVGLDDVRGVLASRATGS